MTSDLPDSSELRAALDQRAVTDAISRMFHSFDAHDHSEETAARFLTENVRVTTPVGTAEGLAEVTRLNAEALGRFAGTQHQATDVLVELAPDGATATAAWNALMTHVHHDSTLRQRGPGADPLFVVGGRWHCELVRTAHGWRFHTLTVERVWSRGEPPTLG
ncbi:nuclear transport factor 2 family protein [Streptomyces sp. 3MP-14]|uniref:Nuclear transport factor 2 family protein n=1 Tax=Streptomyces mimosae TaxID=2586635 RepID=A0A5N6ALW3_9ACTN|nr:MULTISPECIES: nuclear transport factor 2 family protein [Streptomyces]KAB8168598.1 nuclear transport factor 2 family protein [Streptomyces mimosae]KAB8178122.1 nuclear transport factor 2 family protein [Streptomyces sp. 3MP-14]